MAERGNNPNIIQGRMPVAVVHLARFGSNKGGATKDVAVKFGTTVGKVDDIKKSRNFAYVVEDTKFTQAQLDEGVEWLKRHPKYDEAGVDELVVELESYTVATDEEAKAFEAARTAARGQPTKTKDGEVADGGGGNRRKSKKKAEVEGGEEAPAEPTAADLLD
jgi:hypothetical protein